MSVQPQIELEILGFSRNIEKIAASDGLIVEELGPFIYLISPRSKTDSTVTIPLTVLGLTHGNEWVGVSVLNRLLFLIEQGVIQLTNSICVALGNLDAARKGVRFIESDLNRSFGLSERKTAEHYRADALEKVLEKTSFLLDIHQTIEPSENAFFIFPYTKKCYQFARGIDDTTPIVTHWGRAFSKDGQCSDEFVNSKGGTGITIELGQAGFDPYQESYGLRICLQTMAIVNKRVEADEALSDSPVSDFDSHLFTFAETIRYPDEKVTLQPGLKNFQKVARGQLVATIDSQPHTASQDGWMLFPKYVKENQMRPKELYRLLKQIRSDELPNND